MINWHKNQVESTRKWWGFSHYQLYWISFIKGLIFGGFEPARSVATEEFTGGGPSTVTFSTD